MTTVSAIIHTGTTWNSFYAYIPEYDYGYQINSTDYYPAGLSLWRVPQIRFRRFRVSGPGRFRQTSLFQ